MPRYWDVPVGPRPSLWQRLTPPQLFVGSFALIICLGTVGLKLIPGLYTGEPLDWLDALFTSTSAVCVTGLVIKDTATHFTPLGQAYLLLLFQVGGLGMLTFTSMVFIALGGRLSLRQEALSAGSPLRTSQELKPRRLLVDVIRFTFTCEFLGAVFLYIQWAPRQGWVEAIWPSVFHSVSAFCNAGFSTYPNNLVSCGSSPGILAVFSFLIILGGLGFLTLEELALRARAWRVRRIFRLSLHTQLVLYTTVLLLVTGWMLYALLEWNNGLEGMSAADKIANAGFMSVTARSAGFNTIDYGRVSEAGNYLTILLMTIGGSPGSTAGGIKTTTFALLVLLAWSRLRGETVASVAGRSLRKETTDRAVGLAVISFTLISAGIMALTVAEEGQSTGRFLNWMFEAVSAINTNGLSMGQTPQLSPAGRALVVLMMFVGRVGPLAVAAALATRAPAAGRFRYAYEEVAVG